MSLEVKKVSNYVLARPMLLLFVAASVFIFYEFYTQHSTGGSTTDTLVGKFGTWFNTTFPGLKTHWLAANLLLDACEFVAYVPALILYRDLVVSLIAVLLIVLFAPISLLSNFILATLLFYLQIVKNPDSRLMAVVVAAGFIWWNQ